MGDIGVRAEGVWRTVPGPRQCTLLALLALRAGEDVDSGELVVELFGPDAARPPAALQVCVSRLRQALGPHRDVVVTGARGYRLDIDRAQVDALRFSAAVAESRTGVVGVERLRDALDEWSGPLFGGAASVASLEFEERRLRDLRMEATLSVLEALGDRGQVADALAVADAALAWAPDDDALLRRRVELLHLSGRADVARRVRLRHGLDGPAVSAAPAPEPPAAQVEPVAPVTWPSPLERVGGRPLVGRVHSEVVHSARRPRAPQLTLVHGETGRGKTATAAAWARAWRGRGRQVRYLGFDGGAGQSTDLRALAEELDQLASADGAEAGPASAVVVLDDLHALAATRVDDVVTLVRALGERGVPVLLAGRPAPAGSAWSRLAEWASQGRGTVAFELPPLEPSELRSLLVETGRGLDAESYERLVAEVWAATAGNAMAASAVAAHIEGLPAAERNSSQIPLALADLAAARMADLAPSVRQTLLAIVVLDADRVAPGDVAAITGSPSDETVADLKDLDHRDLTAIEPDGWVRAPHPLYREAMLSCVDPLDRRLLHLRAADALESCHPLVAARQRCEAVPLVDAVGAVAGALRALRSAPPEVAPGVGLAVARSARTALEPVPDAAAELRAEVDLVLGDHLEALGRRDEAEAAHQRAFLAALGTRRADLIAAAAIGTEVLGRRPDTSAALDRLGRAADRLEELGASTETQAVIAALVAELFSAGREIPTVLVERLERAGSPTGPFGPNEVALARAWAGWSLPVGEVPPPPEQAWSPASALGAVDGPERSPAPLQLQVGVALRRGDLSLARRQLARLEGQVQRLGTPRGRWFLWAQRSAVALAAGQVDVSVASMEEAAGYGARYALADAPLVQVAHQVAVALACGRPLGEGLAGASPSAFVEVMADVAHVPAVLGAAALLAAQTGEPSAAEALDAYLAELTVGRFMPYRVVGLALAAEASHLLGDAASAARIVTAFEPYRGEVAVLGAGVVCFGPVGRPLALAAATAGHHRLAAEAAESALEWATHWLAGPWVDRCREALQQVSRLGEGASKGR
nr:winged helix-turn-helix domain-containing protein [Rhabdothermincola salaria]